MILELGELKSSTRRRHLWSFLFFCWLSVGGEMVSKKMRGADEN